MIYDAVFAGLLVWGIGNSCAQMRRRPNFWLWLNRIGLLLATACIAYATLSRERNVGHVLTLIPFAGQKTAKEQHEFARLFIMNTFLFVPFGLTHAPLAAARKGARRGFLLTVAAGALFSLGIEIIQFCFSLGVAETADLICNTCGTAIGALGLLPVLLIEFSRQTPVPCGRRKRAGKAKGKKSNEKSHDDQ